MEKFYQLKPGDCFTVDTTTFINTKWDENIFNFTHRSMTGTRECKVKALADEL